MQNPSIIVKDLSIKNQDNFILDGISFSLQQGENLAILGSSGSGKTSLAKAIAGKIYFSGTILFDENLSSADPSSIKFVAQENSFKNLSGTSDFYYQQRFNSFDASDSPTVFDELLKVFNEDKSNRDKIKKIESGLKKLGIFYLKDAPLIQLSSGEHKRFQLIKALLSPSKLLILDSPFIGLDVESRKGLHEILNEISNDGTQLILISGTFSLPDCITHIAHLQNKNLVFFGEKEEFDFQQMKDQQESETFSQPEIYPFEVQNSKAETIVKLVDIQIKYGDTTIIQNFNWKIKQGEKWLLKGPNGAGKSSLLNLITGDHPQAYSNEIYLFGKRRGTGESIWEIKQRTGYVSSELHAYFDKQISCFDTIASGFFDTVGLYKKLTKDQYKIILQWLDFLHLSSHVSNKPLHEISSGIQRLIFLARALVKNPPLLILDEPCQGLDFQQREQLISLIDQICAGSEKTLIYVTHEEEDVPACIQKVLQLEAGKQTFFDRKKRHSLDAVLY